MIKTISVEEYEEFRDDYCGICANCGNIKYDDCEPDMRNGKCEICGRNSVLGIEEALLEGKIIIQ